MLYGNTKDSDIPFNKELGELQSKLLNLKVIHAISEPSPSWQGESGRINGEMIARPHCGLPEPGKYFISGPPAWFLPSQKSSVASGIPKSKIARKTSPATHRKRECHRGKATINVTSLM